MCNPAAVGVISNVMTQVVQIGNQQIEAKENYKKTKYNSEIALANAKEARNNAKLEQQEGIEESRLKKIEGIRQANAQKALDLSNNINSESDTSFYNYDDILNSGFSDANLIKNQHEAKADNYFNQAVSYQNQAKNIVDDYNKNQYKNALAGLGYTTKVASNWYSNYEKK